nr:hypothetical protein WMHIBSEC_WMHIBSEC_CDS_0063 [Caudoviricetes sp.]CAI9751810.1 hypothetical protein AZFZUZMX_AZFZUZMX_CDS_0063 [Caudoviricetes sp.]
MGIINKLTRTAKAIWYANSYVTLDCNREIIFLSRRLRSMMGDYDREDMRLLCFKTSQGQFGFCFASDAPGITEKNETCDICKFGDKVGFYAKRPSVAAILYEYGLPHDMRCRLSVLPKSVGNVKCYIIMPPNSPHP